MKLMGFEGRAYYGIAGGVATTDLTGTRDISYGVDPEFGDTTERGSGASAPVTTQRVTGRVVSIEITYPNNLSDASLEAMKVAAAAGTPIALRLKDSSAGKGYDGDVVLGMSSPYPLKGEQVVTFSAKPNDDVRAPSLYT